MPTEIGFVRYFADLPDPRVDRTKWHRLDDILVITLCAVICGADSFEEIERFGKARHDWLKRFLALPKGIPSHDTFNRVLAALDRRKFAACFARWMTDLCARTGLRAIAVDGKSCRAAPGDTFSGCLHLVSAWAVENNLILGQVAVAEGSHEIAAIPELLETLHLEGCIVTLDAMGCQKDIAAQIRAKGADYLLVLKANHGRAFEAVREQFERTCLGRGCKRRPVFDAFDEGHGCLVRRRVFVAPAVQDLEPLHGWPDLRAVFAVETIRSVNGTGPVEAEIRYFLTSCNDDPAVLVRAIRRHWSVESAPQAQERKVRDELTDRAQAA